MLAWLPLLSSSLLLVPSSSRLSIQPVAWPLARTAVRLWTNETVDDASYATETPGILGLFYEGHLRAVASVERVDVRRDVVQIWSLDADPRHMWAATLLLRTLVLVPTGHRVTLAPRLHLRWHVARAYFVDA